MPSNRTPARSRKYPCRRRRYVSHEWPEKFLKHRIADARVLRPIQKWMKAGVLEEGERLETEQGKPPAAVISPQVGLFCRLPPRTARLGAQRGAQHAPFFFGLKAPIMLFRLIWEPREAVLKILKLRKEKLDLFASIVQQFGVCMRPSNRTASTFSDG